MWVDVEKWKVNYIKTSTTIHILLEIGEGMMVKQLLITYYTGKGNTERMAKAIAKGAKQFGINVDVKRVGNCELDDLEKANGITIGSPTYFSNVAWQVKKLIDKSITLYRKDHKLRDKIGGCFTSSGTRRDGEDCIRMLELTFGLHHKMKILPGIIGLSGDSDEKVSKMCQQYGEELAKRILS